MQKKKIRTIIIFTIGFVIVLSIYYFLTNTTTVVRLFLQQKDQRVFPSPKVEMSDTSPTSVIEEEKENTSEQGKQEPNTGFKLQEFLQNLSKDEEFKCINDQDTDAERDCFMESVCKNQHFNICDIMPEDTPDRTGNKLLCASFVASLTHDPSYCKRHKNPFIANTCLYGYRRWTLDSEPDTKGEFNELKIKYGC